jgi:4-amino-4-deoxy-L-arabinose transferase-like glycosyltransferase
VSFKRLLYTLWLVLIVSFAILHALHLRADFPNHTPWYFDWAKYTDEGWYGNAAIRAHLFGNWYVPGDFNPAPAVPVWPFLEWVLFFFTGVTIQAARGLAVAFFFLNLLLSYLLLRARGARWVALLALTLMVTSPFLYCFSRLAILEPMLTAFTLAALNLAVRLPRMRRPVAASLFIGLLLTLMMLTKTTAVFLLPAVGWALLLPLRHDRRLALRSALAAAGAFVVTFSAWMALVVRFGLFADYKYLFFVNKYDKPREFYWPLLSLWWSFHGGLWVDHILIPLAGVLALGAAGAALARRSSGVPTDRSSSVGWKSGVPTDRSSSVGWNAWARNLLLDPVFGASILAVAGYILFMTYQNHPQPRYFAVVAFFSFLVVAQGIGALLGPSGSKAATSASETPSSEIWPRRLGWVALALVTAAVGGNAYWTLNYAFHPEYTFVDAAQRLTSYIDTHPNGKRLLVSISGDQITLITHMPSICDDFGTQELVSKLGVYQPGWFATWNDIDPGTLEDLHNRYSLEQVASFRALDDSDRDVLVLFKLHPLPGGQVREPGDQNLQIQLPDDKIDIDVE